MASQSTSTRSPSDFSAASIISLGRSMHDDVFDSPEATPLLGHSVQISRVERNRGACFVAVYFTHSVHITILL